MAVGSSMRKSRRAGSRKDYMKTYRERGGKPGTERPGGQERAGREAGMTTGNHCMLGLVIGI